jgi:hypothetical protein
MSDFVQPEILASDATRERGRIVANAFLETRGAGILVYESPMSTPALYVLGRATLSLRRAALDASSFLGSIGSDLGDPGALFLVRVGGPDAAATCAEGVDAGTFRGLPLRRVEGASVFASGSAGFRFCLAGDRAGEVLIGNDLQRELAAIEDSGFDETSRFAGCVIGDNGTQASILCEGSSRSGEGIQFSDRARLVRNPVQSPFPQLPPCGSGGMQAAFAIPLLAFLGRRSRSRR